MLHIQCDIVHAHRKIGDLLSMHCPGSVTLQVWALLESGSLCHLFSQTSFSRTFPFLARPWSIACCMIPSSCEFLPDSCLTGTRILRVTFASGSALRRIGKEAFRGCRELQERQRWVFLSVTYFFQADSTKVGDLMTYKQFNKYQKY